VAVQTGMLIPRPKVSTVVQLATKSVPKTTVSSLERHPYTRVNITADAITNVSGQIDADAVARHLTLMQDSVQAATLPTRTSPYARSTTLRSVQMTSGKPVVLKHGLGEAAGGWDCKRAYAGSAVFAAVEAKIGQVVAGTTPWPASLVETEYLVLIASSTGTYDIAVYPL
jgi:hypothetical protein